LQDSKDLSVNELLLEYRRDVAPAPRQIGDSDDEDDDEDGDEDDDGVGDRLDTGHQARGGGATGVATGVATRASTAHNTRSSLPRGNSGLQQPTTTTASAQGFGVYRILPPAFGVANLCLHELYLLTGKSASQSKLK